jgi:capsular exopolysaccharide synthesis family protein
LDIERQRRRVEDLAALLQDGDFGAIAAAVDDQVLSRLYDEMQNGERDARNRYLDRLQRLTNEAEADLASLEQQRDVLQSSFDRLEAENVRQGERLIELEQLERETSTTRTLYETLLTRLRETSVQRGLQKADARVLTNASVGRYVEPRKSRILLFSALLGAIVGAVVVLWRESGQNGFRTPDELADSSGLPVLGQVPKMPIRSPNQLVSYLTGNPTSAAVEAIRNLRTSIMMSMRAAGSHVLLSTSSVPGEGKTTQAVSLAHNYATLGKKVLLVECDLRRRTLDNYFSVPAAKEGLSALAMGEARLEDCIVRSSISGLDVLLSQEMEINAADFFLSAEFEALIAKLRETYEIIILDAPPVLPVTDSRILGRLSDMILFSVAWDRTDRDQLAAALAEFDAFDRSMIGLVLYRIDARGMRRYGYGERYGAYAAYGRKYYNT